MSKIWVYPKGSDVVYKGPFPKDWKTRLEEFQATYTKKDVLKTLTFPGSDGQMVTVEYITKRALNKRATVWVYPKDSDTEYHGPFPEDWQAKLENYNPTYTNKGLLETLTIPGENGQTLIVERVTKQVLYQRAAIWVCPKGSDVIYQGSFPDDWQIRLDDYLPTYTKNGFVDTLTFTNSDGQTVTVECIAKQDLYRRAPVWVCPKGSDTIYQGTLPQDWQTRLDEFQSTYNKNGLIDTLTFTDNNGKTVTIESITKQVLGQRAAVWVYPKGSSTIYQGILPADWQTQPEKYQVTYKNELIDTLTFSDDDGQTVTIESITRQTLNEREPVWVFPKGSDTIYQGSIPENWQNQLTEYQPTYNENGLLKTLTFTNENGQMITVECTTKRTLSQRTAVWVYPKGSATIYQGSFPEDWQNRLTEYNPTYTKMGLLETLTFTDSMGKTVTIECITKQTLNHRLPVWVFPKGSDTIYKGSFPEDWQTRIAEFQPTYNKKGLVKTLTFLGSKGQTVTVECITKLTLSERATIWVYPKGSDSVYKGAFPEDWRNQLEKYKPTYKKGSLNTLTFPNDSGQLITIECITRPVLYQRTAIWVYPKGCNIIYQGSLPEDWQTRLIDYKPTYNKKGLVETLTFTNENKQTVTIECITRTALSKRASSVWVYPKGSDTVYQEAFPQDWQIRLSDYHPTFTEKGIIETLSFPGDNNQHFLTVEFITEANLKKRRANQASQNSDKPQSSKKRKAEPLVNPQPQKKKSARQPIEVEDKMELSESTPAAHPVVNLPVEQRRFRFFTSRNNNNAQPSQLEEFNRDIFPKQ